MIRDLKQKPTYVKRDNRSISGATPISKETYVYEKEISIYDKRHTTETYVCEKRDNLSVSGNTHISKETYEYEKENSVYDKRPTKETCECEKRDNLSISGTAPS